MAVNSLLAAASSCSRRRARSIDFIRPHWQASRTRAAASAIDVQASSCVLNLYAVASSTVSPSSTASTSCDLALRASTAGATSPPRSPTAAGSAPAWRTRRPSTRSRWKKDERCRSRKAASSLLTRRFSRRSRSSSCCTVGAVLLQLEPVELAVEVRLDRRLADALGQFADGRADVDARQRLPDGDSSPWPSSVTAASRRSASVGARPSFRAESVSRQPHAVDHLGRRAVRAGVAQVAGDERQVAARTGRRRRAR